MRRRGGLTGASIATPGSDPVPAAPTVRQVAAPAICNNVLTEPESVHNAALQQIDWST